METVFMNKENRKTNEPHKFDRRNKKRRKSTRF